MKKILVNYKEIYKKYSDIDNISDKYFRQIFILNILNEIKCQSCISICNIDNYENTSLTRITFFKINNRNEQGETFFCIDIKIDKKENVFSLCAYTLLPGIKYCVTYRVIEARDVDGFRTQSIELITTFINSILP